jgi:O-antigen biosynthesis protein WbqV
MGQPVKIVDLARTMIALAGLRPDIDIKISYSGLRPGEKLFEELFDKDEATVPSGADGVFMASARLGELATLSKLIEQLAHVASSGDEAAARCLLGEIVPEMMVAPEEPPVAGSMPTNVVPLNTAAKPRHAARDPL